MFAKTVLFPVHAAQPDSALDPAIAFCRAQSAHLSVLAIGLAPVPPILADHSGFAGVWPEQETGGRQQLAERKAAIQDFLRDKDISAGVAAEYCQAAMVDASVGLHARYADLGLVLKWPGTPDGLRENAISGVMFDAARPVLLAPAGPLPPLSGQSVLIAWNASVPAGRAVVAAIPLLQAATAVTVLCIDPDTSGHGVGEAPGWDLAQWLARHGIKVAITTLPGGGHSIAALIARHARETGAGLIVAGGYGHSRFRQRLFGGTTSSLLADCALPVLMAH